MYDASREEGEMNKGSVDKINVALSFHCENPSLGRKFHADS